MPKRRRSKAFWKNFKFKYKLTIVNENTLEEIVGLRVSKLNGLSVLLCVLAVLFLIASCIITFTPLRNYLPGYMNSEVRTQIVDNALRVDCKSGTGLCVSGFCGYRCHTDIGIGHQDAHEGVPEHMRMDFFD